MVNAPGPNSGKMATCLSQVYHEHRRGVRAGYAKFETFPIWNLPLRHPVNAAYEAATAELRDVNLIDPFHLEAYDERSVNYNRDVEAFPLLRRILEKITGESMYQSPTDMGVNRAGFAIIDDDIARGGRANAKSSAATSATPATRSSASRTATTVRRIEASDGGVRPQTRAPFSGHAGPRRRRSRRERGRQGPPRGLLRRAVELPTGEIVTGHNSPLMHASSALVLNAIKVMAGIPKHLDLISPAVIESIGTLRKDLLGRDSISLNLEETLIALSISSTTNPTALPGHAATAQALGLRASSDPPADSGRRARAPPSRGQPDLRPQVRDQQAVHVLGACAEETLGRNPTRNPMALTEGLFVASS